MTLPGDGTQSDANSEKALTAVGLANDEKKNASTKLMCDRIPASIVNGVEQNVSAKKFRPSSWKHPPIQAVRREIKLQE